ncbi:YnbE family lipoprotein [Aliidiomarina sanyensis]|uniref:YnbE family lipoprotein n=1 Tax=Aliidiomarina sanyensis TaxID=1249555 RepID=A0A432WR56_9GAMM|nr:YnbE family lipoprotein [Aliidiomarina sanyensis]RUO36292.1 YnbE family lipoprotein [Aliidiomarina sanyensis]
MQTLNAARHIRRSLALGIGVLGLGFFTTGCTPTVQVATPEPITINLNVKIEHEIYIRVARELDQIFSESSGLF